ncbi:MAG TPA: c-type cytochrome [Candidatus Sulfotelmatobacter sp.]|nr:c-type cytochrome [Candidatus Sulfotelmatobacter sp.]
MRSHRFWMALGAAAALALPAAHQATTAEPDTGGMQMQAPAPAPSPIRITSKEIHEAPGGVPRGWKFAIPPGNVQAGRAAFVKFECFKCHAVRGEHFPAVSKTATDVGPDLTGMGGGMHPPEYFAQSIIDPNAVILDEPGYTGPDGRSRMPDYSESMSVRELIDVVAYLESLKGGETPGGPGGMPPGHTMPGMTMPESHGHGAGGTGR